jgi:hypothetical protein
MRVNQGLKASKAYSTTINEEPSRGSSPDRLQQALLLFGRSVYPRKSYSKDRKGRYESAEPSSNMFGRSRNISFPAIENPIRELDTESGKVLSVRTNTYVLIPLRSTTGPSHIHVSNPCQ